MRIRHVVAEDNVDGAVIRDPLRARHCVVVGGRLADLSGEIDPLTHLNLDFPDHVLGDCLIAERLEKGAPVRWHGGGLAVATPAGDAYRHRGVVDVDRRRMEWIEQHHRRSPASR